VPEKIPGDKVQKERLLLQKQTFLKRKKFQKTSQVKKEIQRKEESKILQTKIIP